jgi:hypothetical protein
MGASSCINDNAIIKMGGVTQVRFFSWNSIHNAQVDFQWFFSSSIGCPVIERYTTASSNEDGIDRRRQNNKVMLIKPILAMIANDRKTTAKYIPIGKGNAKLIKIIMIK